MRLGFRCLTLARGLNARCEFTIWMEPYGADVRTRLARVVYNISLSHPLPVYLILRATAISRASRQVPTTQFTATMTAPNTPSSPHMSELTLQADQNQINNTGLQEKSDLEEGSTQPTPPPKSGAPDGGLRAWLVVLGAWCTSFCSFGWVNSMCYWRCFDLYAWLTFDRCWSFSGVLPK